MRNHERYLFEIYIFRYFESLVDPAGSQEKLIRRAVADLNGTCYERMAPLEMAPAKTDCLTSILYIFKRALEWKCAPTWIGDMPRVLLSSGKWTFHVIDSKDARCGDVLFAKRITEPKLLGHMALLLGPNEIFHCKRDSGAVIESWGNFLSVFEQKLTDKQIRYIDPRNTELREKYNNKKFIPENDLKRSF
jgi:hypothetical protein